MNLTLDTSMKLQQKLSTQMIQSLKLLQLNTLQLEQLLKTELQINPVLETNEELEDYEEALENENESDDNEDSELEMDEDEVDWDEYLEEGFDLGYNKSEENDNGKDHYEPTPVYEKTLWEYLNDQLSEKKLSGREQVLCRLIIGSLDPDGFLRQSLEEIASSFDCEITEVENALKTVWTLDPPGIGARNLQECLKLQIEASSEKNELAMGIITETWNLLEKLKIPDIAKSFNVSVKEVQEALNYIKKLHPKPGYLISGEKEAGIVPDLIVKNVDGEFIVFLNDRFVPLLHINKTYAQMLKRHSGVKRDVKKYIRERFNNANWLIKSIEQRKSTMIKVMYAIIEKQREFFEKGPPHLNPLKLQDIADMIEMHVSTISRVTNNKYVQTPVGVYELKYFFSEGFAGGDNNGSDISAEKIKNHIHDLIDQENKSKPLSDQNISNSLAKMGFKVARRTVAKYREQMKILPARLRQQY